MLKVKITPTIQMSAVIIVQEVTGYVKKTGTLVMMVLIVWLIVKEISSLVMHVLITMITYVQREGIFVISILVNIVGQLMTIEAGKEKMQHVDVI